MITRSSETDDVRRRWHRCITCFYFFTSFELFIFYPLIYFVYNRNITVVSCTHHVWLWGKLGMFQGPECHPLNRRGRYLSTTL